MRRSRVPSSAAAVLALLAATGSVALAPGAQAAPARAASAAAAPLTRPVAVGTAGPRVTLLPTGERVVLRPATAPGARQSVSVDGRGTSARSVQVVRLADRVYAVPDTAKPYLGRILDLGLFDASTATPATGRVRVSIGYSGAVPRVPGVTLTRSGGGHADGYLTASSARAFGSALARTYAADAKAHWPRRTTLFGARTISAAASRPSAAARPAFVMRTLVVKGVDVAGKPVPFGFVVLVNVEDGRRYGNAFVLIDGEARVSVPDGTYAALGDLSAGGAELLDAVENIRVQGPGQTLTLDARRATSTLGVSAPRPAKVSTESFDWVREDAGGYVTFDAGFFAFGSAPVKVSPVPAPALGTLASQSGFSLTGTAKSSLPYTYDAVYPAEGIPAQQSHALSTRELAAIDSRYAGDDGSRMTAGVIHLGLSDVAGGSGGTSLDLRLPARRLEYLRVTPGVRWMTSLFADNGAPAPIIVDGGLHAERARTTRVETWLQGPIALRIPTSTAAEIATGFAGCPVCRDRDDLLAVVQLGDTTPDHVVAPFGDPSGKPVARFRVYKDGVLLADQPDVLGAALTVPPSSGRYRLLVSLDRRVNRPRLSTASILDVTFVSSAATGAALPGAVVCGLPGPCRVPAVLQASVALPVDTAGSVHAGVHHVVLTLGHQQFATGSRVTSGFVQVRIGAGRWVALTVKALGHGRFSATLRTTAAQARSFVDLRVGGKDAGGGSLTQTTTHAFVLSR